MKRTAYSILRTGVLVTLTVIALALAVLWIDSYRRRHVDPAFEILASLADPPNRWAFHGLHHGIAIGETRGLWISTCAGDLTLQLHIDNNQALPLLQEHFFFFSYWTVGSNDYGRVRSLTVPIWFLFCAVVLYPAMAMVRGPVRRWHRRKRGACVRCGYDLTGNVSRVCPECALPITAPESS
jgi:hypothetical protein